MVKVRDELERDGKMLRRMQGSKKIHRGHFEKKVQAKINAALFHP